MIKFHTLGQFVFVPHCRGAAAAGPLAVSAIAQAMINDSRNTSAENNVIKQINAQKVENALNRSWQTVEAEKARMFNFSERQESQDFQRQMVAEQNAYNDPSAQAQRFRAAGLNPFLAMGSNGIQSISASPSSTNMASSPTPSSVSGLSPVAFQPSELQIPSLMNGISTLLTGLADAKKSGVETSWLEKSMDLNLRNLSADADLKEITAKGIQLDNYLKDQKLPYEVRRAVSESFKVAYDAVVSFETIGKVQNETALLAAQKNLNEVLTKYHDANTQLIGLDIASYWQRFNSSLKLQSAQANAANASAVNFRASASLSEAEKLLTEQKTGSARVDRIVAEKTIWDKIDSSYQELLHKGALSDTQVEEYQKARKSASWYDAQQAISILKSATSSASDVVKFY